MGRYGTHRIPWKLVGTTTTHPQENDEAKFDNAIDAFKWELSFIFVNKPRERINVQEFDSCMRTLRDLLEHLESLVSNQIVDHHLEQNRAYPNLYDTTLLQHEPPNTSNNQYKKLQILAGLRQDDGTTEAMHCTRWLTLTNTNEQYEMGSYLAYCLNKCLESLQHDMRRPICQPQNHDPSNWESLKAQKMSSQLYRVLADNVDACKPQSHQVMFQLDGYKIEEVDEPAVFDVFINCCSQKEIWRGSTYTAISKGELRPKNLNFISNFCGDVKQSTQTSLWFCENHLWYSQTVSNPRLYPDAFPSMPLEKLLEEGYLREVNARGPPGIQIELKVVLALSLARCLLHFFPGSWTQSPWTAENIHFVYNIPKNEVLNIQYPYINCRLSRDIPHRYSALDLTTLQEFFSSFACLLFEIETGVKFETRGDDMREALEEALFNRRSANSDRELYYQAVEGALGLDDSLKIEKDSNKADDPVARMRKVIYFTVVRPLQQRYENWTQPERLRIPRTLRLHGRGTVPVPRIWYSADIEATSLSTTLSQPPASRKRSYTSGPEPCLTRQHKKPRVTIMFDGVDSQNCEHAIQARSFFQEYDRYLSDYRDPKTNTQRAEPRIRIVLIDTGIDKEDSTIMGLIRGIKDERKLQGSPAQDRDPIKHIQSFMGDSGLDTCSHGTYNASLLLKLAPDADIYIAKVSSDMSFEDKAPIAKAIDWALSIEANIINMSFGMSTPDTDVEKAIQRADGKAIMLAAASNYGANRRRTFPASDLRVIGIHATSGNGARGSINPSFRDEHDRFGTLGLGLEFSWQGQPPVFKSGTSYASPVAAATAANWLEWLGRVAEEHGSDVSNKEIERWRSATCLRTVFQELMSAECDGLHYIAPWHFWKSDKTGVTDRDLLGTIKAALYQK
ncbi:peptidase S8/S53 domain-containing protein [Apiospora marii]|uniref:peptidase S8/S53 domain-containing protein n=1 Tax=Apiospora marii TaxID=335849 RepID=UPI003131FD1E